MRTLARTVVGDAEASPFVQATKARSVKVKLDRKVLYELDGGDRTKVKSFKVKVEPAAVTLCVLPRRAALMTHPGSDTRARAPSGSAKSAARTSGSHTAFEWLARAGFVARGLIYAIIGVLALKLALGAGGKTDRPAGSAQDDRAPAVRQVPAHRCSRSGSPATRCGGSSRVCLGPRARRVGLRVRPARRTRQRDRVRRALRAVDRDPARFRSGAAQRARPRRPAGVLGWPGGTWIVGVAGAGADRHRALPGLHGLTKNFLEDAKTGEMGPTTKRVYKWLAIVGHCRPDGRVRPDRHLPDQGCDRLPAAQGGRPRRRAGEARAPAVWLRAARCRRRGLDRVRALLVRDVRYRKI